MTWYTGLDGSVYQGQMTPAKAKRYGIDLEYLRAGVGYDEDLLLLSNARRVKRNDLRLGVFHFWKPELDTAPQIKLLLDGHRKSGADLVPTIDVEWHGGQPPRVIVRRLTRFVAACTVECGKPPAIYTGASFWNTFVHALGFGECFLWQARYLHKTSMAYKLDPIPHAADEWARYALSHLTKRPPPVIGFGLWDGWQFAGENDRCGVRYGCESLDVDVNIIRGGSFHKLLLPV